MELILATAAGKITINYHKLFSFLLLLVCTDPNRSLIPNEGGGGRGRGIAMCFPATTAAIESKQYRFTRPGITAREDQPHGQCPFDSGSGPVSQELRQRTTAIPATASATTQVPGADSAAVLLGHLRRLKGKATATELAEETEPLSAAHLLPGKEWHF